MIKVAFYSLNWNVAANNGIIVLLLAGETQTRQLAFNNGANFAAAAAILRGDPNNAVFFDPNTNVLASGKDAP